MLIVHATPESTLLALTSISPEAVGALVKQGHAEQAAIAALARTATGGAPWVRVPAPPPHPEFQAAWRIQGDAVGIDLGTAREVKREMIRTERAERWTEADARYNIAHESGVQADVQSAARYRQRLRDAPAHPDIENAADADALAAITLDDLL